MLVLAIEFLDEFVFGAREAAWPQIRDDFGLTYVQIGVLLSVPGVISNVIEPLLGLLADTRLRKPILVASGVAFTLSIAATAIAGGFAALLVAMLVMYPASGGFVSLAQASYMDAEPNRRDRNMARWVVAGSVGALLGSLLIGAAVSMGAGWRPVMAAGAGLGAALTIGSVMYIRSAVPSGMASYPGLRAIARDAAANLRNRRMLRWLLLLQTSDLLGDIFLGFLAVYLVDVAGAGEGMAALGVTIWIVAGLVAGIVLEPLLNRFDGVAYVRLTALLSLAIVPLFLLVPGPWPKLVVAAAIGFIGTGWYTVLQARLYDELPDRSGTVMALTTVFGPIGTVFPFLVGAAAGAFGLEWAMWIVLLAPLSILMVAPRNGKHEQPKTERE